MTVAPTAVAPTAADSLSPPLDARVFASAMARLGPFAKSPHLAVALSGGADSLALTLLADAWARRRGGRVTALTVDHGLRPEAAAEARQAARWLRTRGIAHRTLRWRPPTGGRANLQAKAREARYGLLTAWCRDHGVADLLVAHHREDQAETFLLRLARGSGVDGLAAMAPASLRDGVRLLRPLLDTPKAALVAYLRRRGQPWIEDPSNADPSYARVRLRALMPQLAEQGLTAARLAATAARLAQARAALGDSCAVLLAEAATLHDAGYVYLDPARFAAAPREIALRALARLLLLFGGQPYTPRYERLCRLADELFPGKRNEGLSAGRTLAGCRILPQPDGRLLVLREARAIAPPLVVTRGATAWDGRFILTMARPAPRRLTLGALGDEGWRALTAAAPAPELGDLPRALLATLPALRDRAGLYAVPHLAWRRGAGVRGKAQVIEPVDDYVITGPLAKLRREAGFTLV